jgi:hypothetical protein
MLIDANRLFKVLYLEYDDKCVKYSANILGCVGIA